MYLVYINIPSAGGSIFIDINLKDFPISFISDLAFYSRIIYCFFILLFFILKKYNKSIKLVKMVLNLLHENNISNVI